MTGRALLVSTLTALTVLACQAEDRTPTTGRAPVAPAPPSQRRDDAGTGALPQEPPPLPEGVRDVDGVVVRARGGTVVIQPADGETVVLALGPEVPVTVEGRAATAAELREGCRVRAAYTFEDGDARVVRIEVEREAR
jgi:hypothetical protein